MLNVKTFCRELRNKIESTEKNEEIQILESRMPEQSKKRSRDDKDENTNEDPENEEQNNTKRRKSGKISEKGMKHISRITKIISEKKQVTTVEGIVNGQTMEIILDYRGEFNVITKAALKIIENKNGYLQRLNQSISIPS